MEKERVLMLFVKEALQALWTRTDFEFLVFFSRMARLRDLTSVADLVTQIGARAGFMVHR